MKPPLAAQTAWRRVDQNVRRLLPALSTLMLGLLSILPIGVPAWGTLAPPLMLMAVFYWSLVRPDLMPPTAAFALGLLQDGLTGAPLGSGALVMVLTQWTMRGQQRFLVNRPFTLLWAAFVPVGAAATLMEWLTYTILTVHLAPMGGALIRMALGFVLFPVVAWVVLIPTHRNVPSD
jgi:rod shape-determining protein MreD